MSPLDELEANKEGLPWVVQKYGGTSIGKFVDVITSSIIKSYMSQQRVVVVCSARSGESKAKGTTNRLLRAAEEALKPGSKEYQTIVKDITEDHLAAARLYIANPDILRETTRDIEYDCWKLRSFLEAAEIIDEVSPRSRDIITGVGEKLSCRIVAAVLRDRHVDAEFVSLDNVIEQDFVVENLDQSFYDYLSERMAAVVRKCGNRVPVVTGFFGNVPGSLLSTVGRGYTDLCAALIAVGLAAEELQIWKEVDGIFTADPRKVPGARLLPIITPEEAAELTYYGSEVIHPFTMEQVIRARIPIRIKNVENPGGRGTIIFPDSISRNGIATPPHPPKVLLENGYHLDLSRKHPTAVTVKDNVVVLNIHSNRKSVSHGFLAQIFGTLDKYGIVIDLISTSEVHISMAFGADLGEREMEKVLDELKKLGTVDLLRNMAILSLVGKQMKNMVGVASRMFSTLAAAHINIEMISQGASEINISCVIAAEHAHRAIIAIHDSLLMLSTTIVLENSVSKVKEGLMAGGFAWA